MPDREQGGRTAIITGGAGGLGQAMSRALIADGVRVAIMERDAAKARRFADTMHAEAGPGTVLATVGDVSRETDCARCVAETIERFGTVDILVNNAGIGPSSVRPDAERNLPGLAELTPDIWQNFFAINVTGTYLMTRAVTPGMRERGWGRVVNNTTSFFTMLRVLPYGATKAALEAASAVWAKEFDGTGITVNVVVPGGPTDTDFIHDDSGIDRAKMLRPEIMGPPLRWLASAESDGVTGRRFVAAHWDANLPPAEAAEAAGAPIGWPKLAAATVVWPDD